MRVKMLVIIFYFISFNRKFIPTSKVVPKVSSLMNSQQGATKFQSIKIELNDYDVLWEKKL